MGAWGTAILQDDVALDFLDALRAAPEPFERMREALEAAATMEYLDYDAGQAALVSAGVVDTALGGGSLVDDDGEFRAWLAALDAGEARALRTAAVAACRRLLAPGSELQELWAENEEDDRAWKTGIDGIAARLASG